MSTPIPLPDLPTFFVDRSLGRIKVPEGLRALGVDVVALDERYGIQDGQNIDDVVWMPAAAEAGEAVFMSDAAIRARNPTERQVLIDCGLRAFVINARLSAPEQVGRFEASLPAIIRACRRPGPFVYRLHPAKIELLRLN